MSEDVPAPLVPIVLPALRAVPGAVVERAEPFLGGGLIWFRFPNGYGASVVRHSGSYGNEAGLFEVAVLRPDGSLDYTTPITDSVIGWLTADEVAEVMSRIAALPAAE